MNTKTEINPFDESHHPASQQLSSDWHSALESKIMSIPILTLDHMGIRVSNFEQAIDFYSIFGFEIDESEDLSEYNVYPLIHSSGVRINLILNAVQLQGHNILLDSGIKYSGITHLAFIVKSMDDTLKSLKENKIDVTEGPIPVSNRRIVCFIRDPDGNVLEFNELLNNNSEQS